MNPYTRYRFFKNTGTRLIDQAYLYIIDYVDNTCWIVPPTRYGVEKRDWGQITYLTPAEVFNHQGVDSLSWEDIPAAILDQLERTHA